MRSRLVSRLAAALALALAALLAGCATNPVTHKRELVLVTPAQEAALGREGHTATLAEYGAYDDAALAAYVDSVGRRVARASDQPGLPWRFTILDDAVVNAFALPGGYIYVTRGLLAHLQSEAQLAGVLGHEIGHVTARHSARHITQQTLAGLGLRIAVSVSPTFERYGGVAEQALGLLMLKYSRDDESQADELGVRYATVAGYDPRELPATYRTLQRIAARAGQSLPVYLSTHPDPGARAERTASLAARAVAGHTNPIVRQRGYLEHVRDLVYGENPRYGWFEGGTFYHPVLGLQMRFPEGWRTQHTHTALTAVAPDESGLMQLTLASGGTGRSPGEYVVDLSAAGRVSASKGGSEVLGAWPAWVGTVNVANGQGTTSTLAAGWVRLSPDLMLQVLGRGTAPGDAQERQVFASIRSMGPLLDAARSTVQPHRLRVVASSREGAFRTVWAAFGSNALPPDEGAILNGFELDDVVPRGRLLKVADRTSRP